MVKGIKLYKEFRSVVEKAGPLKMAWFTTFNLSLSFFEKYVLPTLVGMDYQDVRNLKDFETLNSKMVGKEDDPIDVRVYYDYRAIRPEVKRTCVSTFGVDPAQLDEKFRHGVFHPKVCLLVNQDNEGWLVTGSANLSLSAWSTQSECIAIRKIEDLENANAVVEFFQKITDEQGKQQLAELNEYWHETLRTSSDWEFVHSFSEMSLLDKLDLNGNGLHVWSPYFSDDVAEIIEKELGGAQSVSVIPDVSQDGKVRISHDVLTTLSSDSKVQFLQDDVDFEQDNKPMVHAKVWSAGKTLGIGSWNFTYAGLNLSDTRSNVEAGIVQSSDISFDKEFIASCSLKPLAQFGGLSEQTLQDQRQELWQNWSMTCWIYADWSTYEYTAGMQSVLEPGKYFVDLPGAKERIDLFVLIQGGVKFHDEHKQLLKDRLFTVYDEKTKGQKVYIGVIVEMNPVERPAMGFDSFNEFIRSWSDGKPEENDQLQTLNYLTDLETGEELREDIAEGLSGDYTNAWFTMFLAFEKMRGRLENAKGDERELRIVGYHIPGSVTQLRDHLDRLKASRTDGASRVSDPFLWFMINEGNTVVNLFNDLKKGLKGPRIQNVPNIPLKMDGYSQRKINRWLSFIREECGYHNA